MATDILVSSDRDFFYNIQLDHPFDDNLEGSISDSESEEIFLDFCKIINDFFKNKNDPVTTNDISTLKSYCSMLYFEYKIVENDIPGIYQLSVKKRTLGENRFQLELTNYADKKINIHLKVDKIE